MITDLNEIQRRVYYDIDQNGGCDGQPWSPCQGMGWVTVNVPIGHPAFGVAFRCLCQQQKAFAWHKAALHKKLGLPIHYQDCTFEYLNPKVHPEKAKAWLAAKEIAAGQTLSGKVWLTLSGEPGMGKSGLAAAIVQERISHDVPCMWIDFNEFLSDVYRAQARQFDRDNGDPEAPANPYKFVDEVGRVPLLVLGCFGHMNRERPLTDYQRDQTYNVIRARYENRLPTVITTNLDYEGLLRVFGSRIPPRIAEMSAFIGIAGQDFRMSSSKARR